MSSFRIRPRFEQMLDLSFEEIRERIDYQVQLPNSRCVSHSIANHITIKIVAEDQHFWSPQLSLNLEENEDGRTLIRGLYGPNPHIWALFFYGYSGLGILGTFAAIIGLSQWTLEERPWGLWVLGLSALVGIGLYAIAQTGQKLGAAQTFILHHCYEEAMDVHAEIH